MGVLRVARYDVVAEPGIPARQASAGDDDTDSVASSPSTAVSGPLGADPTHTLSASTVLEPDALERGFGGDAARLRRFVSTLRDALPAGTTIALRGSTIAGQSYKTGEPFDAEGPGTSDLDVVVVGEPVLGLWVPEAQLLGGINTLPLSDDARWVAPSLDRARRRAQAVARRPVSIQAMAGWFLDLRTLVQGQPYVVLDGDT
jgi:hypothetical protein